MPTIDNLSVQITADGTQQAVSGIEKLASAVQILANGLANLESGKFQTFAAGLKELGKSAPTEGQTTRMVNFADAVTKLSAAIGNATDLKSVASDIGELSRNVRSMSGGKATTVEETAQAIGMMGQNAKTATQDLAKMTQSLPTPDKVNFTQMSSEFTKVNQAISNAETNFSKFGMSLKNIGLITTTKKFDSLQKQIDKTREKYNQLREEMAKGIASGDLDTTSKAYERQAKQLDGYLQKYNDLMLQQKELALAGGGVQLNPNVSSALQSFQSGFSKTASVIKNLFVASVKSVNSHLKKLVSHLFQADKAANLLKKSDLTSVARKVGNELLRVSKMLKLMVTRMALRAVIKEIGNGFKSLALHSDEFNNAMSNIINGSKQLGYSFASMLSPLINALAPAIVYIINLLTKLLNVINQVFSALTGKGTWNKAKNFTDSWRDSITGAGSAASKTAKELKKTVLGFDELNQLQDNKNSGGGGGGSDIKDMFDTMKIDDKWKKFADWLKKMWELGDFTELGKMLGTKLRDFLRSIPWDLIKEVARKLGSSLATLINGIVEVEGLGWEIGHALAESLNTIFEFLNEFVHKLHWDSIGKFIAETFNGFFESIDWDLIKDTVITGMAGLAQTIQTFIEEFHWDNISNTIANAVNIIAEGIYTFVKGIKWGELGAKLGDQLMKTIKKINFKKVGKAIGAVVQAAIDFFADFIAQINVDDVVKAVSDLIDGFFEEVDPEKAGKTLAELFNKIVAIAKGIWTQNKSKILGGLKKLWDGFWGSVDKSAFIKVAAAVLGACVLGGITSMVGTILKSAVVTGFSNLLLKALFGGGATGGAGGAGGGISLMSSFGVSAATAFASAFAVTLSGIGLIKKSVFDPDKAADFGVSAERLQNLSDAYSGVAGTARLFKEALGELWYTITGNEEKLEELHNKTYTLTDDFGNITKTVDTTGNTIIEIVDDVNDSINGQIQVYDNWRASFADASDAAKIGADRMIDISVGVDEMGKTVATVSETIFPKLGDNIYKCASAEDSIALATREYREQVKQLQDPHSHYMGTLEVIREAQRKNVKIHEEATTEYGKFKTVTGEVGLYIKDTKDAYVKAGDAAKEASDKTSKYMSSSEDIIKITPVLTDEVNGTTTAYNNAKDSAEKASYKIADMTKATEDVTAVIPDMNKQLDNAQTEMGKTADVAKETGDNIVKGIQEPIEQATFGDVVKSFFDSLYYDLCDIFGIASPAKNMNPVGDNIMLGIVEGFNESVKNFTEAITKFYDDTVKPWFTTDKWTFDGIEKGLKASFDAAVKAIKDVWNGFAKWMNEKLKFKVDDIDIGGQHILDGFEINLGKLPTYSTGGMPEDGLFFANHSELVGQFANGKTAVANNGQIIAGIESGVYNAVTRANANMGGNDKYIVTEINVDSERLATAVSRGQAKNERRYSPSLA